MGMYMNMGMNLGMGMVGVHNGGSSSMHSSHMSMASYGTMPGLAQLYPRHHPSPLSTFDLSHHQLKDWEDHYYNILAPYKSDFDDENSALVWLIRAHPSRTWKLSVPKTHRFPRSSGGHGGYALAFADLGLVLREADTITGHWHSWYAEPRRVILKALQAALLRRLKESKTFQQATKTPASPTPTTTATMLTHVQHDISGGLKIEEVQENVSASKQQFDTGSSAAVVTNVVSSTTQSQLPSATVTLASTSSTAPTHTVNTVGSISAAQAYNASLHAQHQSDTTTTTTSTAVADGIGLDVNIGVGMKASVDADGVGVSGDMKAAMVMSSAEGNTGPCTDTVTVPVTSSPTDASAATETGHSRKRKLEQTDGDGESDTAASSAKLHKSHTQSASSTAIDSSLGTVASASASIVAATSSTSSSLLSPSTIASTLQDVTAADTTPSLSDSHPPRTNAPVCPLPMTSQHSNVEIRLCPFSSTVTAPHSQETTADLLRQIYVKKQEEQQKTRNEDDDEADGTGTGDGNDDVKRRLVLSSVFNQSPSLSSSSSSSIIDPSPVISVPSPSISSLTTPSDSCPSASSSSATSVSAARTPVGTVTGGSMQMHMKVQTSNTNTSADTRMPTQNAKAMMATFDTHASASASTPSSPIISTSPPAAITLNSNLSSPSTMQSDDDAIAAGVTAAASNTDADTDGGTEQHAAPVPAGPAKTS